MDFSPQIGRAFDQAISADALDTYRLDSLNAQLRYAKQFSRFYGRSLACARLPLDSLTKISGLPFTSAETIISQGMEMVCIGAELIERIVTLHSTGSSGRPKRLMFSKADLAHTVDFFHVGMQYLCGAGDRVGIFMPALSDNSIGRLLADGLVKLGAKPQVMGIPGDMQEVAGQLRRTKPHTLVGIPSQMRKLALLAPDIRPAKVLLSADYISLAAKETISRIWGCAVFEHYGLTESGYGCAVECPAHAGQHIRHDELLLEIVEPNGLDPSPAGQWGEIVLTTLRREAMPLIRYRTGDMSRLIYEPCPCGSALPRLDRVVGRIAELANAFNIYEMDEQLQCCDGILDYRAVFSDGVLQVAIEAASPEAYGTCAKRLGAKWPDMAIHVLTPDEPLPIGEPLVRNAKRGIDRYP